MTAPSLPSGYDETRHVQAGRPDCHITVGFDQRRTYIPRFIVQLHYQVATGPVQWTEIARMDHNETSATGHDVYREGLHVDVSRRSKPTVYLAVPHVPRSTNRGLVLRNCDQYLREEAGYFVDVYEEQQSPGSPPRWPDGGDVPPKLITLNSVIEDMSQESPVEDALTPRELSEVLAEATGTTVEEIEWGAEEMDIAPPEVATVVDE